jgi:hypothetical protein
MKPGTRLADPINPPTEEPSRTDFILGIIKLEAYFVKREGWWKSRIRIVEKVQHPFCASHLKCHSQELVVSNRKIKRHKQ